MPSWSGVGNIRPVSTTTILPSYSTTVMFLPISPRPPSGITRSFLLMCGSDPLEQALGLQGAADHVDLGRIGLHHRQPRGADVTAHQPQGGLHRRGGGSDGKR